MLIRIALLAALASCADGYAPLPDVEMNPLSEEHTTQQPSMVCNLGAHICDPYDPGAAARCSAICWSPAHCRAYTPQETDACWRHPGSYWHGGYCSPFGEPTWPTQCVEGLEQ